ncbi:MAG: hypothetical protein ACRD9L_28145 [Bryobacteraceae bacterium]
MPQEETKRALIVVRTYPVPDALGIESSCTAAITDQGEWLRLFPVPWRLLNKNQRFRKYEWVQVAITKAVEDPRLESYRLRRDGVQILSEPLSMANAWKARKDVVLPLMAHCLCCLTRQRDVQQFPTLGIVRPASIVRLRISPADPPDWTPAELAMLRQQHLFAEAPTQKLEKIPFKFIYEFRCPEATCTGHNMMCTDWEMGESYRRWRSEYGEAGWQEKFRQRYATEMMQKYDTHFYVGTVAAHPNRWIIVGLFYPPREEDNPQFGLF